MDKFSEQENSHRPMDKMEPWELFVKAHNRFLFQFFLHYPDFYFSFHLYVLLECLFPESFSSIPWNWSFKIFKYIALCNLCVCSWMTTLLRKFTYQTISSLKNTIQWVVVLLQSCAVASTINFKHFTTTKEIPNSLSESPFLFSKVH